MPFKRAYNNPFSSKKTQTNKKSLFFFLLTGPFSLKATIEILVGEVSSSDMHSFEKHFPAILPSAYVSIFIFMPFSLFVWYFSSCPPNFGQFLSMCYVWVLYIFRQDSFFLNLLKWCYFVFWILFCLFYDILAVHGGFCQVKASRLYVTQAINRFCALAFRGALHLL